MAEDQRVLSRRQFPLKYVQISAANAARTNAKKHLTHCRLRLGNLFHLKRLFRGSEDGGFH
jgi:hypothetical protein